MHSRANCVLRRAQAIELSCIAPLPGLTKTCATLPQLGPLRYRQHHTAGRARFLESSAWLRGIPGKP